MSTPYKLNVIIPASHVDVVKAAMFEAGGGRYEHYDCCCYQQPVTGQFRALADSDPYLGQKGSVTRVEEYQVSLLVPGDLIETVIQAAVEAHPYETPPYEAWPLAYSG